MNGLVGKQWRSRDAKKLQKSFLFSTWSWKQTGLVCGQEGDKRGQKL